MIDIFDKFIDKNGKFKKLLIKDTRGMLSLYEASYLGAKGEENLLEAMEFTKTHLTRSMPFLVPQLSRQVSQSLKQPRHLRMARLEARNYIDEYGKESDCNSALLELAKLDFDMVQLQHQRELNEIVRCFNFMKFILQSCFCGMVQLLHQSGQITNFCYMQLLVNNVFFVIDIGGGNNWV